MSLINKIKFLSTLVSLLHASGTRVKIEGSETVSITRQSDLIDTPDLFAWFCYIDTINHSLKFLDSTSDQIMTNCVLNRMEFISVINFWRSKKWWCPLCRGISSLTDRVCRLMLKVSNRLPSQNSNAILSSLISLMKFHQCNDEIFQNTGDFFDWSCVTGRRAHNKLNEIVQKWLVFVQHVLFGC